MPRPCHPAADRWNALSNASQFAASNGGWDSRSLTPNRDYLAWLLRRRPTIAAGIDSAGDGSSPTRRDPKLARLEAVLLIADRALSTRRLSQLATLVDSAEAAQLIEALNAAYDRVDSAFRIERVATGFQLLTRPQFARWLDKLHHRQSQLKLSPPALETLTIVAYRQPVTRADVEQVRGVQCTEMLKQLMERNLVRIAGHDDSLGRPYLYGTTRTFLELFGLRNLHDLPMAERLRREKPRPTAENNESEQSPEQASEPIAEPELDAGQDDADAA